MRAKHLLLLFALVAAPAFAVTYVNNPDTHVTTLAAGESVIVDARALHYLTVIVATGGTATVSRVDSPAATTHTDTVSYVAAVGSEDFDIFLVDWPFYMVSVADAGARVAVAR